MALVEDEAKFPHERQNTVDRYQHHEQLFRVICTTVVIIAGFVAAGTLAYFEAYTAASIAVGATLVGLASAFVGNASKSQKLARILNNYPIHIESGNPYIAVFFAPERTSSPLSVIFLRSLYAC